MYIPILLGSLAFIILITLIILDRKEGFNTKGIEFVSRFGISREASERLFSTLKGFLVIFLLAFTLGAVLYYL